jgi:5-methylcytosine-specific restriction endonuclease McrA
MRTYEFDDSVLSPERFRFHVLRTLSVREYRQTLLKKQDYICPLCKGSRGRLDDHAQVDHIIPVKWFADNLALPLTEAYKQCHDVTNLRAVHSECNNARNRKGTHRTDAVSAEQPARETE